MILITDRVIGEISDIAVANDKEVIKLAFKCRNQVTELLKLTDCTEIYINYQNGSTKDRYLVNDLTVDGEYVTFSWLLGANATKKQGKTFFVVCAQIAEGGEISQEWNTELAFFNVNKGLETVTAETEPLEDIFSQLIEMIDGKQDILTAGSGIIINNDVISATVASVRQAFTPTKALYYTNEIETGIYDVAGDFILAFDGGTYEEIDVPSGALLIYQYRFAKYFQAVIVGAMDDVMVCGKLDSDTDYYQFGLHALPEAFNELATAVDEKQDKGDYATETELTAEASARQNADNNLQGQIDALAVASDVVDVVGTYADLVNYDTTHIKANDIIKVLTDSTHSNALSYYRWVITGGVGAWVYVGSEGPFYTKAESDVLLQAKLNTNQGSSNVGKVMTVGADGMLSPETAMPNLPITPLSLSPNTSTALSSLADGTYIVTDEGTISTTAGGSISFVEGAIIAVQSDSGAKFASVINGLYAGYLADQSDTEIELYVIPHDLADYVKQSALATALNLKANKATTYTKTEVDDLLDGKVSSSSVSTIWTGTQLEYDAITTKDSDTLYFIVEASS